MSECTSEIGVAVAKLAINGGSKVREHKFPAYRTIGQEEKDATMKVLDSGILSRFLGSWHDDFYGGPQIRALEKEWAEHFKVKHAVAMNSATSGLFAAVGALGIEPGDEVIVSPYTMTASAVAPLIYNAIPVFADIEPEYYCLSLESIEANITPRTKAIIIVDIFGQPYNADAINALAKKHGIKVIEDCAQAPGATLGNQFAGTLGDIGVYSLNYHKHIHTGEGTLVVTNDDDLAERLRLIRNHAEQVVEGHGIDNIVNMLGFNYRMTEIEATIAREQLKKLDGLLEERKANIAYLEKELASIPCLEMPKVRPGASHVYIVHPLQFNAEIAGMHRNTFVDAVKAELAPIELRETEGVRITSGYLKPLYLQPLYQKKIAYGSKGCPWTSDFYTGNVSYEKGICPVAESMYEDKLILHELMRPGMTQADLDDVVAAFTKVWDNRGELI